MSAPAADDGAQHRATVEFARTADGWDLALHHYLGSRDDRPPVILCPGYACNRHFIDFDARYSLARFLARRGLDAWVLELRGHGLSEPAEGHRQRGWTFDDLVRFDVPAAIDHVRHRADGRCPVWVGHSMGGMIVYAALGQDAAVQESLAGLVAIATPVAFPPVRAPMARRLGELLMTVPLPRTLPQRWALSGLWGVVGRLQWATAVGMNPANVDRRVIGQLLRRGLCNVPRDMLRQLAQWSLSGEFRSCDGRIDYRANLRHITTAALILAGTLDRLAPPDIARAAYEQLGATRKAYREFGVHTGDSADYGHMDLIFGRRAPEEVFPVISAWIADTPSGPSTARPSRS